MREWINKVKGSASRRFRRVAVMALVLVLSCAMTALAAEGNVTYRGDAGEFIFAPGSEYSPTDLFPNFKDVMPGDSIVQSITVKNDPSHRVKVKIYMRSLGAHADSVAFLSQLRLRVEKSADNTMSHMFDAAAHETAQLTDWVYLGTLYSGGQVNLNVILDVPVELDNVYQQQIGYLDWEFMIEELPVESTDPKPGAGAGTGDEAPIGLWIGLLGGSVFVGFLVLLAQRRKRYEKQ